VEEAFVLFALLDQVGTECSVDVDLGQGEGVRNDRVEQEPGARRPGGDTEADQKQAERLRLQAAAASGAVAAGSSGERPSRTGAEYGYRGVASSR
jgi:hypothetical protein